MIMFFHLSIRWFQCSPIKTLPIIGEQEHRITTESGDNGATRGLLLLNTQLVTEDRRMGIYYMMMMILAVRKSIIIDILRLHLRMPATEFFGVKWIMIL